MSPGSALGPRAGLSFPLAVDRELFIQRYLAGELDRFFATSPRAADATLLAAPARRRAELAEVLRREAERLGAPPEALESAARLAHPKSRVVVTGQQAGLLLGPAYTVSKALSAIKLARELDRPDSPVVPIFWLASQDHDRDEVDHTYLLDLDERLHRIELHLPANVPAGQVPFDPRWLGQLEEQLRQLRAQPACLEQVLALLRPAPEASDTYADLFASTLTRLLGGYGLLVLDPTRPAAAPLFAATIERELREPEATVEAIRAAGRDLRELGFQPQLGRATHATNLFITELEDGLPRRRLLRWDGRSFSTATNRYSRTDLLAVLAAEPGRITPAAGLRPVVQDELLPTVALVAGPGELRYLAQLRGVYDHHGVRMPLIWPRTEITVLEPPVRRLLERYGLDYDTYSRNRDAARDAALLARAGHGQAFDQALASLERETRELLRRVDGIDPTLRGTVERTEERLERAVELLRRKVVAALERQDGITTAQFSRLEAQLFPLGAPQERVLSAFSFFLKFGVDPMMRLYDTVGSRGSFLLEP